MLVMLYLPLGGGAVSRKAIESQCHHPPDKLKLQSQMLTHKISSADTKSFIWVSALAFRKAWNYGAAYVASGKTESSLKSWVGKQ